MSGDIEHEDFEEVLDGTNATETYTWPNRENYNIVVFQIICTAAGTATIDFTVSIDGDMFFNLQATNLVTLALEQSVASFSSGRYSVDMGGLGYLRITKTVGTGIEADIEGRAVHSATTDIGSGGSGGGTGTHVGTGTTDHIARWDGTGTDTTDSTVVVSNIGDVTGVLSLAVSNGTGDDSTVMIELDNTGTQPGNIAILTGDQDPGVAGVSALTGSLYMRDDGVNSLIYTNVSAGASGTDWFAYGSGSGGGGHVGTGAEFTVAVFDATTLDTVGSVVSISTAGNITNAAQVQIDHALGDAAHVIDVENTGLNPGQSHVLVGDQDPDTAVSAIPGSFYLRSDTTASLVYTNISAGPGAGTDWIHYLASNILTTLGDVLIHNGTTEIALTIGGNGDVLTVVGGSPTWVTPVVGITGTGTDNRIVRWDGTTDIQDSGVTLSDTDDITGVTSIEITETTDDATFVLDLENSGTNPGQSHVLVGDQDPDTAVSAIPGSFYLRSDTAESLVYTNISAGPGAGTDWIHYLASNILTTLGDVLIHNGTTEVALTVGGNGDVLTVVGGSPTWITPVVGVTGTGTDNRIVRWDGTTDIQDSGVTLSDTDDITGVTSIEITEATDDATFVLDLENTGTNPGQSHVLVGDQDPDTAVSAIPGSFYLRSDTTASLIYTNISAGPGAGTDWIHYLASNILTTLGDILIHNGTTEIALTVGGNGDVLTVVGGSPTWITPVVGVTGTGTDNRIVRWDGTTDIQDSGVTLSDTDDITGVTSIEITETTDDATFVLDLENSGTNPGQTHVLVGNRDPDGSVTAIDGSVYIRSDDANSRMYQNVSTTSGTAWVEFDRHVMTTTGDLVFFTGGADTRLPIGTANQVLTVTGGVPTWEDGAGGGGTSDDIHRYFGAPDFLNPVTADWDINALAPIVSDPANSGLSVRSFDSTIQEGIGFTVYIPAAKTQMDLQLMWRTSVAAAAAAVVVDIRHRLIADGATPAAWASDADNIFTVTTSNDVQFHYTTNTATLATRGLTADNLYQFELTRDPTAGGDTYVAGDWLLMSMILEVN